MQDESYIVRIYRRSLQYLEGEDGLVGVVEDVVHEQRRAFHNLDELMTLLKLRNPAPPVTLHRRNSL